MNPLNRIIQDIPLSFFIELMDETNAAWSKACKVTQENYQQPERANMLGQNRHAFSEAAFRMAAKSVGLNWLTPQTEPAGGRYSLVRSGNVYLIRSNIQSHCGTPRPTSFRKTWSAINDWIDPYQLDLLKEEQKPDDSKLCAMIVTTANVKNEDPTIPAYMGLGIPNKDLTRWTILKSIEEVITLKYDHNVKGRTMYESEIKVKDAAMPRITKRE